jgi:rubredoxin
MKEIVRMAFEMAQAVEALVARTRNFYYEVMLSGQVCSQCAGGVTMIGESRCRCTSCGLEFDPTIAYQRCTSCNGAPRLRISRYVCRLCGRDVPSRFVFDGRVFDREYFRQRMAESRERNRAVQERAPPRQVALRSDALPQPPAQLSAVPGLAEALNGLVGVPEIAAWLPLIREGFDFNRYQTHLQAHIGPIEVCFDDLPSLDNNARMDRIWRFVALVFMTHAGDIDLRQEGRTIWVMQCGTDGEGQGILGETETLDGVA